MLLKDQRVIVSLNANASRINLQAAVLNGHSSIVALLLKNKVGNPTANQDEALRSAASRGHLGVVSLLLKNSRVSLASKNNEAIRSAAENGHLSIFKRLLNNPKLIRQL